jgi:hypothetical protein
MTMTKEEWLQQARAGRPPISESKKNRLALIFRGAAREARESEAQLDPDLR